MKAIWVSLVLAASLSTIACGGGVDCAGGCQEVSECEGNGDYDVAGCEDQCETQKELADEASCSSEYEDFADCASDNKCEANPLENCASEFTDYSDCLAGG